MERDRRPLLVLVVPLVALAACATLAGIEQPSTNGEPDAVETDSGSTPLPDGLSVEPARVSITTSCQDEDAAQAVMLGNKTDRDVPFEVQVPEGSPFVLGDGDGAGTALLKGTLRAGDIVPVSLRVAAKKAGAFDGSLIVRLGQSVTQVPVTVTVTGGSLAFSPAIVDFGDVRYDQPSAPSTVQLENTGTERVNVIGFTAVGGADGGGGFTLNAGGGSIALDPGKSADVPAVMVPGEAGAQASATFEPQTETPTCGALPKLSLQGRRVNDDVTVNPVLLDFGNVDCGSAGGPTRTLTISNYSTSAVNYTATTAADARYVLGSAAGVVPPALGNTPGTVTLNVTRRPPGTTLAEHSDTLDVSFLAGGNTKTTSVALTTKTVGAMLAIQPTALANFGTDETKTFRVTNDGNRFVFLRHTSSNAVAFVIPDETRETPLQPGASATVKVRFAAATAGQHSSTVTTNRITTPLLLQPFYPSSGQLCEAAPTVSATATR